VCNTPFNKWKRWTYEGGTATPLVIQWPEKIRNGGKIVHDQGHVIDIMATVCDVTGVTYPETYNGHSIVPLEGKSLLPVLTKGKRESHEALYFEHGGDRAVIKGQYKLLSHQGEPWKLFDLVQDRIEKTDLADQKPELVHELEKLYEAWANKCSVLSPEEFTEYNRRRPQYKPTRYYWLNIWRKTHNK
jgi:arylsulfatase